LRKDDLGN